MKDDFCIKNKFSHYNIQLPIQSDSIGCALLSHTQSPPHHYKTYDTISFIQHSVLFCFFSLITDALR